MTEEENRIKKKREETEGAAAAGTGSSQATSSSGVVAGPDIARSRGGVPIVVATRAVKTKAEEDAEKEEKRSEEEVIERGVKRSFDDREGYAKMLRSKSEQKATEAEQAEAGVDVGQPGILGL